MNKERKENLKRDLRYWQNQTFTLLKMSEYYGHSYADTLDKCEKEDGCACCMLGQMFEESVHHVERANYDYPPLGYTEAAKCCYELAYLYGYRRGAYNLGELCRKDGEYEQAEKWLLIAEKDGEKDSCRSLSKLYRALWEQDKTQTSWEKIVYYLNKNIETSENESSMAYAKARAADFYKDVLKNGMHFVGMNAEQMILKMIDFYKEYVSSQENAKWAGDENESLMEIFFGDYKNIMDIEQAFYYGKEAIKGKSSYAAFRLGKYLLENESEQYEKIVYYLERAVEFSGTVDGAGQLLKNYISYADIPEYLKTEASLLLDSEHFVDLAHIYEQGFLVKQDLKLALFFYIRAMEGIPLKEYVGKNRSYDTVYDFFIKMQGSGFVIQPEAWKEIDRNRVGERPYYRIGEEEAVILADLNEKYHILNMSKVQQEIDDMEFIFEIPEDQVADLESDFYSYGIADKLDCMYMQKEIDCILEELSNENEKEKIESAYSRLSALSMYGSGCTTIDRGLYGGMKTRIQRIISDRHLDSILNQDIKGKIEKCLGCKERELRRNTRLWSSYTKNWNSVLEQIREKHNDFLEYSEEKEKRIWEM